MNYTEYLKSTDWKEKRNKKRKTRQNCGICNAKENLDTHHLNYRNLTDVGQFDLRVLCRRCHFLAHKLMKQGKMHFRNTSHHSRFAILKHTVKKELGITTINMFLNNG